jgi:hypothetical protein
MDKFQQLAWDSTYAVGIVADPKASNFELIELGPEQSEARSRELSERGMVFVGVIGIVNGLPRASLAVPLDPMALITLSQAFIHRIEDKINGVSKCFGDSNEWMTHLYNLPDTRNEVN